MNALNRKMKLAGVALAVTLTACGGGGGDSPNVPGGQPALTVSGTATTGTPIANKAVEAKCATGALSGTTQADGSFSLSVDGGKLPCLARVTADNGTVLHSVAQGSGSTATVNITPVTQLVVASLAGTDPAAYYTAFDSAAAAAVTSAAVAAAQAAVVATLKSGGVDLTPVGDVISAPLAPAYTAALNSLTTLTSSVTTLAALTMTVAATSTTSVNGTPAPSGVASLPADLLLKPAARTCAALRSGSYRVVAPFEGPNLADKVGTIVIDAATLGVVFTDGSTGTWGENGPCRFSDDGGKTDIVVSQAGVLSFRYTNDAGVTYRPAIAFPAQSHTLAEVANTWNLIGLERNDANTGYTGDTTVATLDAAGAISAVTHCQDDATWSVTGAACAAGTPSVSFKANADGGFDLADKVTGAVGGRGFAYRAGGGELMMVLVDGDGSFHMLTRQRSNGLPTVGVVQTYWNFSISNQLSAASAISESTNTIASLDSTAGSWVRSQKAVGSTVDHPETLFANNPRDGYTFRQPATVTASDGSTVNVSEFTVLGMRGMGISPLILPASKTFLISVQQ